MWTFFKVYKGLVPLQLQPVDSCYNPHCQGIEYITPKVMRSYVWFLTRNCGSGDHRRVRISVILFLCLGYGGWEDTLMHSQWHACALLSLEHFPIHTPISHSSFRSQLGNRILPEPFLSATTWASCHISVFPSSCLYHSI